MTETQFRCMLESLKFNHYGLDDTYTMHYSGVDGELVADFHNRVIRWPAGLTVTTGTTSNFSQSENFVVFECVHRLLEMGYQPKDIELEPKWKVGHGSSGGRADIWVRTKRPDAEEPDSLLIIECKTFGKEFNSAWKDTLEDGDQLFGYFAQAPSTKFLCLYASDYANDKLDYTYHLINVQDNEEYLKTLKNPASFEKGKGTGRRNLFKAWKETYKLDYATIGLFEKGIAAYHPGKSEYTLDDLKAVDATEIGKMYHRFAETLRKYNVSGRENAFDKLVNLMLAKVVDELQNGKLQFNWKGAAYDDDFRLQDRLQRLYKEGMQKFLGEDVTYIDDKQIDQAFHRFKNDPDATRDTVRKYVRQLKFFTNNDFAFIDVHNEKLFNQNAVVLREVVRMLQDVRLRTDAENQFLGDLFENFLDQGVKQSEGQFFTPIPFVRFMVSSLPVAETIASMSEPPVVVDYACGAGHFLNEYARQAAACVKEKLAARAAKKKGGKLPEDLHPYFSKYYDKVYGIEKEYRLSKVSKVASFMYGQDEIHIIYADALVKNDQIKDGSVNFLFTNPPYSVKGFLETLSEEERKQFKMSEFVEDTSRNDDIECYFIERAAQLLAPGGMAAIVLPASILGTKGGLYEQARNVLLEFFEILAIVEMGPRTFGKTGTNTATLFIRRKKACPDDAQHIFNRVSKWFLGDFSADEVFADGYIREKYCAKIGVKRSDYDAFLKGSVTKDLSNSDLFVKYRESILEMPLAHKIQSQKLKPGFSSQDRDKKLADYILSEVRKIEFEKLRIFMMAMDCDDSIVVVKGPTEGDELSQFLGYEWSGRKGAEGLHIIGVAANKNEDIKVGSSIDQIKTPLFNPHNLTDNTRINTLIRANCMGEALAIPESLADFVSVRRLSDMIDFTKVYPDNAIHTVIVDRPELKSKYEIVALGKICDVRIGGTPPRSNGANFGGENLWVSVSELAGGVISDTKEKLTDQGVKNSNVKLIPAGTTLLSFKLSIGKTAIAGKSLYTNEAIAALVPKEPDLLDKYLYYLFTSGILDLASLKGDNAFGKSLNSTMLKEDVRIPRPPKTLQEKVVKECEKVAEKFSKVRMSENDYQAALQKILTANGVVE